MRSIRPFASIGTGNSVDAAIEECWRQRDQKEPEKEKDGEENVQGDKEFASGLDYEITV